MKKQLLPFLFAVLLVFGLLPEAGAASDLDGHWAKDFIEYLEKEEVYFPSASDGSYKPDQKVTRAEFMRYVNRAFHFTEKAAVSYTDVSRNAWYYETVQIAEKYGYINGVGDNKINPMGEITREQAAIIIGRLFKVEQGNVQPADLRFTDNAMIGPWCAGYIKAATDKGIITGYSDGTFKPKQSVTRAEVSKILYYYIGTSLSTAGKAYYGTDLKADTDNVTISESCTLTDAVIKGDLYLTEGLGSAAVTLSGVTVEGTIVISGGTVNMVNTTSDHMIVSSALGRLLQTTATGVSRIEDTFIQTTATLYENSMESGQGFQKVTVDGASRVSLTLNAELAELDLLSEATVTTTAKSVIQQLTVRKPAAFTGYGAIRHADILSNGVSMSDSITVTGYTLAEGVSAHIAGDKVTDSSATAVSPKEIEVDLQNLPAMGDSVKISLPSGVKAASVACDGAEISSDTAYSSGSDSISLLTAYLGTLESGKHVLKIGLSNGRDALVDITVKNTAPSSEDAASVAFDRYYQAEGFADRTLHLKGVETKTDIQSMVLGLSGLDYEFDELDHSIKLRRGVLGQLPTGVYTVTANLADGTQQTIRLTITDSAPEDEVTYVAEYNTYRPAEPCYELELGDRTVKAVAGLKDGTTKVLTAGSDYKISSRGLTLKQGLLEGCRIDGECIPFYVTLSDKTVITLVVDFI